MPVSAVQGSGSNKRGHVSGVLGRRWEDLRDSRPPSLGKEKETSSE